MKLKNRFNLSLFYLCEFSKEDALQAAQLDIDLEEKGKRIKKTNIIIAAITINRRATLCTFDQDFLEFEEFGLRLFR